MSYATLAFMARPIGGRLSEAFRATYEAADVSQEDIAAALGVDQPTVSKWARGMRRVPLEALPVSEKLCGVPRGTILRRAGFVDDIGLQTIEDVINADPVLSDADKKHLLSYYQFVRAESALSAR